eukprot:TRINITY_DN73490_c0_g1_i1.p1 TRINITY_DN73490_c0_g1~~TRINITY_DN73490_c0_g1_i1.p1  ORF type:complete len:507 (-),score=39.58 TRINITY_DN73490_c0_g1_i1:300-1820(-)
MAAAAEEVCGSLTTSVEEIEMREVESLTTFGPEEEEYLRSTPINVILRRGGNVFKNSTGAAETYALSEKVKRIGGFVSHNWSVGRVKTFSTLALQLNYSNALTGSFFVWLIALVAHLADVFPMSKHSQSRQLFSIWGRLLLVPSFVFFVLFVHDLKSAFGAKGPGVFLDKTCINQIDEDLKRRSILKLGAFLAKSDKMYVVYTSTYLKKMWTVYEIAAFLCLRGSRDIAVLSVRRTQVFVYSILVVYICSLATTMIDFGRNSSSLSVMFILIAFGLCLTIRVDIRSRSCMIWKIATFDIKDCTCTLESDRALIHANISLLMRAARKAGPNQDALEVFNELVRTELREALLTSLGRFAFRVEDVLMYVVVFITSFYDDNLSSLRARSVGSSLWRAFTFAMGLLCTIMLFCCFDKLSSLKPYMKGVVAEVCWFLICFSIAIVLPGALQLRLSVSIRSISNEWPVVPVAIGLPICSFYVYVLRQLFKRRTSTRSHAMGIPSTTLGAEDS